MATGTILVANELRSEREAIGLAIGEIRPEVRVLVVDPSRLSQAILEHSPILIICSQLETVLKNSIPSWVLLPSDSENLAVVSLTGHNIRVERAGLQLLISIVDEAVRIRKMT